MWKKKKNFKKKKKYLSLDNGVTMTSKRRENINLVSFICLSFLVVSFSKQH